MKEKLLMVGAGGLGRVVSEHICDIYDCAFLDDGKPSGTVVCGVPVIGAVKDLGKYYPEYQKLLVTIGNNPLREKIYQKAAKLGYTFPNVCKPLCSNRPGLYFPQQCSNPEWDESGGWSHPQSWCGNPS